MARFKDLKRRNAAGSASAEARWLLMGPAMSVVAYTQELGRDEKAGRAPRACPPDEAEVGFTLSSLADEFAKLPPEKWNLTVKEAVFEILDRRFICPARGKV